MKNYPLLLFVLCASSAFAQDANMNVYTENAWAARDKWQKADELIRQLDIKSGSKVADIGSHEGYMTVKLATVVKTDGRVYAVDVDQPKLDKLKDHLAKRNLNNVELVKGDYDDPKLPLNALDAVIILDAYHEMRDHDKILKHTWESLKPGARLILCEPIADERRKLSRADQEKRHELGMNFALEDLQKIGFTIVSQQDPFVDREKEKGDNMWLIVARK
jgi:precorrin-6B methylase 2